MMNEWDLTHEWLESLKIVREAGMSTAIPVLARQVEVEWAEKELLPCARIIYKPGIVRVQVNPALTYVTEYRVERLEILTYIAAESLAHLTGLDAGELKSLCIALGCANTRLLTPRERWRRLGMEIDPRQQTGFRANSLVAIMYEDRPSCGWCHTPIATLSASLMRKDLHEGCYDYVVKVVRPQVLEERKQRLLSQAAAAEK